MPATSPDIHVVIPTYKRTDLVLRAIDSVLTAAAGREIAITVVDNHSPEDPGPLIRERFGARVHVRINPANLGMIGNWNVCRTVAQEGRARTWMLLEDDNVLEPDFFDEAFATLEANPAARYFHCAALLFDDAGTRQLWRPYRAPGSEQALLLRADLLGWAFATQIKVSALLIVNDPAMRGLPEFRSRNYWCHDLDALCRFAIAAEYGCCSPRPLMRYYLNPVSVSAASSNQATIQMAEMLRALRENVDALAATGWYSERDWRAAARRVPIDRLMLAALSLHGRLRREAAIVRATLSETLVERRAELTVRRRLASGLFGTWFWHGARVVSGVRSRQRREGTCDY